MPADDRDPRDKRDDDEPDQAPETPPDEPSPPHVQDPPPQPDSKGPYVVAPGTTFRTTQMTEADR